MKRIWLFLTSAMLLAFAYRSPAETSCVVPGYERLRAAGGDWQAEAGEVLLSELSCLACHGDGKSVAPLTWKQGPNLTTAGDRLRAAYVRAFLADPAAIKPGTTMPHLLAAIGEPQKTGLIEDLTHHLMGQRSQKQSTVNPVVGSAKTGRTLYLSVGCVACHGDKPMERLGEKYAPGELARFLLAPLNARPAGRMPDQHLSKKDVAHLAAYLAPASPAKEEPFVVDPARAQRGQKAFAALGCAACHDKEPVAQPIPLVHLQGGCLAAEPKAGIPFYRLSEEQRGAIQAALTARTKPAATDDPKVAIRRLMLQRNCFACHVRGGLGGPAPEIAIHFTSTKDDLGDLGRLPPPLDGVGRKLLRPALETVLKGRGAVRNYMRVRMPGFGDDLARELSRLLAAADTDAREKPVPRHSQDPNLAGTSAWGRELVGTKGYACIACHNINGQASLGIGAYDMAEMPKRLRPEWMRDFLLNPTAFPTGSRMPQFWPEGRPMNPDLGGGTTERQIDSIRRYLAEVDESLPPEGLASRSTLVLKPEQRPLLFRTFLKGTGTHAIAIGFPGGVNVAFDALAVRWSMAWRGSFIDADGTWNQRYIKMEQPLGEDLVHLEEAGTLSIAGRDEKPTFRGYHLGKDGVPIFDYELGALRIEDRVEPTAQRTLKRTLRISGQTSEVVQLTAHPPAGLKVQTSDGAPLPSPLAFQAGTAELVEEISW